MKTCRRLYRPYWHQLSALIATVLFAVVFCVPIFSIQQSMAYDSGSLELRISSDAPAISDDNLLYSLADARFGVYRDYQCTQKVAELVTDSTGFAAIASIEPGRYFVRQELASPGFSLSTQLLQADVPVSKEASVNALVTPCYSAPDVLLRELDAETGMQSPMNGARLGGAVYNVSYYDSFEPDAVFAGPARSWRFQSDAQGNVTLSRESLLEGSPLFVGPHDALVMPIGRYRVTVEKEPLGYVCASPALNETLGAIDRGESDPLLEFPALEMSYQVVRGDVMFRKTDAQGAPLAGIPFLLSTIDEHDNQPVESHVLVTDAHGDFCSHNDYLPREIGANGNDEAILATIDSVYQLDESKLSARSAVWFSRNGAGTSSAPVTERGALPYGSYLLQELPCSKNANMNLSSVQFSIHRDDFVVKLDNIVSTTPSIFGYASDLKDGDKLVRPASDVVVRNKISYQNLVAGKPYALSCSAIVSSTGAAVYSAQGAPAFVSAELTPTQSQGTIVVELPIDASKLAGERIEIVAELRSADGTVVIQSAAQPYDQGVQVEPSIQASVSDARDGDKYCMGDDALVRELVEYKGLSTDRRYTLLSTLQDKVTGNAVRDVQGNVIVASTEFVPEAARGSVALELPLDASSVAGHDIVVFDRLIDDEGVTVANHQDIDDFDQTVKTVKLSSYATDKEDGDKRFDANATGVTIRDSIGYANLIPGHQYELQGVLMDKDTGCALMNGENPVSASTSFVAQEITGTVDVEFAFDASAQSSQTIVAFESLEHDGNVIAEHKDLEDVAQTVTSEEIDPDSSAVIEDAGNPLGGSYGSGKPVLTGDQVTRLFLFSLLVIGGIALCIAYVIRMRRKTLEAIARVEAATQVHDPRC